MLMKKILGLLLVAMLLTAAFSVLDFTSAAAHGGGGDGPKQCPAGKMETTASSLKCVWEKVYYWDWVCTWHRGRMHCEWVQKYYWDLKCYWTQPVCEVVEKPTCPKHYSEVSLVWDDEADAWIQQCRCDVTGYNNIIFVGTANSQLPTCTLRAAVAGSDMAIGDYKGQIPVRMLNPTYVNATCSCPDCDNNERGFIWNEADPVVEKETYCTEYPSPLCH
jgi:hypothetical protein